MRRKLFRRFPRLNSMSISSPRHSHIAIVGHGVSALTARSVFHAEGISPDQIISYGDQADSFANFRRYTHAIQQDRMRSESNGHFFPTDFPGLALLDSLRNRTPLPLLLSLFDQYQPRLNDLLAHGAQIAHALEPAHVHVCARITRITSQPDRFLLHDHAGNALGTAQHVILALGHPGLRWPEPLNAWRNNPRVTHAYQPKQYCAGETALVVGAGMAAAHEWLAALRAGSRVVALSRHPLRHQPLNAPRCNFTAAGLDAYRRLNPAERHAYLDRVAAGSHPWRAHWEWELTRARQQSCWRMIQAEVRAIEAHGAELIVRLSNGEALIVNRIVSATGFVSAMTAHTLIAQLVADYAAPVERGRLLITDDFSVPQIGNAQSRLAVIGNLARWALPVADTFMGMKYVARRLLRTLDIALQPPQRFKRSLQLMGL